MSSSSKLWHYTNYDALKKILNAAISFHPKVTVKDMIIWGLNIKNSKEYVLLIDL